MRIAINGYGRIGRAIMRAWIESTHHNMIDIVAVNTLGSDLQTNMHLTRFDSTHGRLNADIIQINNNTLAINGKHIKFYSIDNIEHLPWGDIDLVLECTGQFTSYNQAIKHVSHSGAKRVLLSAPIKDRSDATVIYGLNHNDLDLSMKVISNGSCTTNCLAPIVKILDDQCEIISGFMTTVHSYTQDQTLLDNYHSDITRARAGALSMVPTKTHAIDSVCSVLPKFIGRLDGIAVRVPVPNVSLVDFTCVVKNSYTKEDINQLFIKMCNTQYHNIVSYTSDRLASIDFNHSAYSGVIDLNQTKVSPGNLIKVLAWYDNEWGFANRMLDVSQSVAKYNNI